MTGCQENQTKRCSSCSCYKPFDQFDGKATCNTCRPRKRKRAGEGKAEIDRLRAQLVVLQNAYNEEKGRTAALQSLCAEQKHTIQGLILRMLQQNGHHATVESAEALVPSADSRSSVRRSLSVSAESGPGVSESEGIGTLAAFTVPSPAEGGGSGVETANQTFLHLPKEAFMLPANMQNASLQAADILKKMDNSEFHDWLTGLWADVDDLLPGDPVEGHSSTHRVSATLARSRDEPVGFIPAGTYTGAGVGSGRGACVHSVYNQLSVFSHGGQVMYSEGCATWMMMVMMVLVVMMMIQAC